LPNVSARWPNAVSAKSEVFKSRSYGAPGGRKIAEKFPLPKKGFPGELNPGRTGCALKPGDQGGLQMSEPFRAPNAVKDLKPGHEIVAPEAANQTSRGTEQKPESETASPAWGGQGGGRM